MNKTNFSDKNKYFSFQENKKGFENRLKPQIGKNNENWADKEIQ